MKYKPKQMQTTNFRQQEMANFSISSVFQPHRQGNGQIRE